jgi:hypothetical protein
LSSKRAVLVLVFRLLMLAVFLLQGSIVFSQVTSDPDVVLVIDTSISMKDSAMDPKRVSLLASKLLSDVVPGKLSVIRLLDMSADQNLIPSVSLGRSAPCTEGGGNCVLMEFRPGVMERVRSEMIGAVRRPSRGSTEFKRQLDSHLEQKSHNSLFGLAFRAGLGIFDQNRGTPGVKQTLIWLSDGMPEDRNDTVETLNELKNVARVEAIVFGRGDTSVATQTGLQTYRVSNRFDLMSAFADAFRRIVQAPYRLDGRVAANPNFEIRKHIEEAWIVVYGDDSLRGASVTGPSGRLDANYATDQVPGAGIYRVAHMDRPADGSWTIAVDGGGAEVAYAVVQRSGLVPVLIEPKTTISGVPTVLVAALEAGKDGPIVPSTEIPEPVTLSAVVNGQPVTLHDDGANGDERAGDGKYSGTATFTTTGTLMVPLTAKSSFLDRTDEYPVTVTGEFRYSGGPITLDFGTLTNGMESCRPLTLTADHQGQVPFELSVLRGLPSGHSFVLRSGSRSAESGASLVLGPQDAIEICLIVDRRAPSSEADGEPWLRFRTAGADRPGGSVEINARWTVHGLTWWQRWAWLIILLLLLLAAAFLIYGYIRPKRFPKELAVAYAPELEDLDEQTAQPLSQWKGVGIGFYRDAQAFLHPDFRISGKQHGALAKLHAVNRGAIVSSAGGAALFVETGLNQWEPIQPQGRRYRSGDVFRVSDHGPYFRISARVSR